jgi:hypothetical protein
MSADQNKAAVRRAIEILETLDANALVEVFSPELTSGWREVMNTLPVSDHHIKITGIVAEGDQVAIRSREPASTPASGREFRPPELVDQPRVGASPGCGRQDHRV